MKRGIQKTVSVLLAIVMMLAVAVPAFASEEKVAPVIVVSGMASFPLINEENGKSAFPMENDVLTENIMKMILPLLGSAVTNQWEIFAKYGVGPIHDLFEAIRCDRNGDSIYKVAPKAFPMSADNYEEFTNPVKESNEIGVVNAIGDKIGLENTYFFYYDWRMNPMSLADDLNETVERVKAERNSDKVSLVALSFGGMITSSYIYKYGTQSLKNVVYASTAFNGVDIVGQLFAGNIEIEIGAALDYLSTFMQSKEILASVFGIGSKALSQYGVVGEKAINNYLSKLIDVLKYPAYSEVFMDTYAAFQGIWCLMPIEYYEQSKEFMMQTADLSEEFISEVDEYMYNVQGNLENLLDKTEADGVSVYIVGAYGYAGIPLTPSSENQTDTLIDTDLMTGNSMVAPFGKRLNSIAYSTRAFAENTTIFRRIISLMQAAASSPSRHGLSKTWVMSVLLAEHIREI